MKCAYCHKKFEDDDHIIEIDDDDAPKTPVVHYNCYDQWIHNRFFSREAVFEKGKVKYI